MDKDIRWIQRFSNYRKALKQLKSAVDLSCERSLSELEQQGMIQAFEYTHELAWNTLKDFLEYSGNSGIFGSRDATRESFKLGILKNGETWMNMIISRNQSSHTYNQNTVEEIVEKIKDSYLTEFIELEARLEELSNKNL